ncbi:sigma-70 family RNA polymerase sigma factor [Clostridium sediminicola]|uniref:RNA polymerase sigma factor n=1 Tax=Clostridium sediminicola TaxID=3114879 RepID=UPI0031F23ADE
MHISLRTDDEVDEILKEYSDTVYKVAYSQTKDRYHAEDVFQEVFLRLIRKRPEFENKKHLKAWLIRVTINCSKNIFLSSHFKKRAELNSEIVDNKDEFEKSQLYDAVMALPKKYRTVIHLYYYEGYLVKEIAALFNKKEATIKTNLHRGRKLLGENLKGDFIYE